LRQRPGPGWRPLPDVLVRHLRAFPGASKQELARWWGVPSGKLSGAFARIGDTLRQVYIEGTKAIILAADLDELTATQPEPATTIRPLGGFDPYTLSLQKEAEPLLPIARRPLVSRTAGWISAVVLSGGAVAGTWTHEVRPRTTIVEVAPWRRLKRAELATVQAEVGRIGEFLAPGNPVQLTIAEPS
jgi:hypothetical protein